MLSVLGCLAASPVAAQTRTVVVPAGDAVVIAPRSQPPPRATLAPPPRTATPRPRSEPVAETLAGPSPLAGLALAGAAGLAAALGGGGGRGGGGAPSRTR
ncbi:hypothetical protein J5Y09_10860 [Roseomonas sp. PWR1]|uniref:Uncharacterized protein n=1 Tax=Roseomonas nitratireducens TaxID=2820810 RepID=A0ABS4AT46_9PROT|nr:hypothetical protein [Neoroseomonas nitratireducens]MBP0464414.1 hypothetical protein [Neoroseomonas nitratireducens]